MRVQSRRTDEFPTTWELPLAITVTWLLGSIIALPFGQGLACAVLGDGFLWPEHLGASLLGLVAGEPGHGIPAGAAAGLPPSALIYACVAVAELGITVVAWVGLARWWHTVGPFAQFGMASRHEVERVVGRWTLVQRGGVLRPDLLDSRVRGRES